MSQELQSLLANKPSVKYKNLEYPIRLFYVTPTQFQLTIDGFFPIIGKFMKAKVTIE
jgi:hypothetical protein